MIKEFTIDMPDQPFYTTTSLGKTHKMVYEGPEYIVISIDTEGKLQTLEGQFDSNPDLSQFVDDRYTFRAINADDNTVWCAWLTGMYTHEDFPNYEEELPDGNTYKYDYPERHMMDVIYKRFPPDGYKYNESTGKLDDPVFYTWHVPGSEKSLTEQAEPIIARWKAIDTSSWPDNEKYNNLKKDIDDYLAWLETVPTVWTEVDPWKIHWMSEPSLPSAVLP